MSTTSTLSKLSPTRNPLGLPAGSVRAILVLLIAALYWAWLLLPTVIADKDTGPIPLYLHFLLPFVLLFFNAHGHSIAGDDDEYHPLYLPPGTCRVLIIGGTAAIAGYLYWKHPDQLFNRLTPNPDQLSQWPQLLAGLAIGFVVGRVASKGPWRNSGPYQDLTAWVSLLAMLGLAADAVLQFFVQPSIPDHLKFNTTIFHSILTGLVAFYFAARSH
jgi:hypothetical protein